MSCDAELVDNKTFYLGKAIELSLDKLLDSSATLEAKEGRDERIRGGARWETSDE